MDDFRPVKEAVVRAAYRAILKREPEEAVLRQQTANHFSPAFEAEVEAYLATMIGSDEFKSKQKPVKGVWFPPETWVTVTLPDGAKLRVDLGDEGVSLACMSGNYEPTETKFFDKHVKSGATFVDIGANIGWFSIRAAHQVGPSGRVIAFEPRNTTAENLLLSVSENKVLDRVEVHRVALGAAPGVECIGWHTENYSPGATWFFPNAEIAEHHRSAGATLQQTAVDTLDAVIAGRRVDFIKIDVEGAEGLVMAGAVDTLARSRPVILSEINQPALAGVSRMSATEYIELLRSMNYRANTLTDDGSIGEALDQDMLSDPSRVINVLFVPA